MTGLQDETSVVTLSGRLRVVNINEKVVAEVRVPEPDEPGLSGFMDMFSFNKAPKPAPPKNDVKVEIYKKIGREKLLFATGSGNYARYLQIGGRIFFQHSSVEYPTWIFEVRGPTLLPSSAVIRKDLELIQSLQFEEADAETTKEHDQLREDDKRRMAAESAKKGGFTSFLPKIM